MLSLKRPFWWVRFWGQRSARWATRILIFLIVLAICSPFLASELPWFVAYEGTWYFPAFRQILVQIGLINPSELFTRLDWQELPFDAVIHAPIPYDAATQDYRNASFVGPFEEQDVPSLRFRHWLGTDQLGRDVFAGLLNGLRVGLFIAAVGTALATLIGVCFGSLAGFWGNNKASISVWKIPIAGMLIGIYVFGIIRFWALQSHYSSSFPAFVCAATAVFGLLSWGLAKLPSGKWRWNIAFDATILMGIEVLQILPGLMILIVVSAFLDQVSVFALAVLVGMLVWTTIARFVRGEIMRIKGRPFVQSAELLGLTNWQVLTRHVLPNVTGPLLINVAFLFAGIILLEASLSFLGLGTAADVVTWGKQLNAARDQFSAWWMAVFPGLAITLILGTLMTIGQALNSAISGHSRSNA